MSLLSFFGLSPNPTDDFWYGAGRDTQTAAGVSVDESVAMTYSACWACTRLLSTCGGMIPLKMMRKLFEGGSEPADNLNRYWQVHDHLNPHMTNMSLRSNGFARQVNAGNAFFEIEMDGAGKFYALHPIHPSRIPRKNIRVDESGQKYYLVNNDNGTQTRLEDWEVLHVPSTVTEDGIYGLGVVAQARLSIGFGLATETQGASYFGNSARPKLVITGMKFKDKADREDFRQQWDSVHGGPANSNKIGLIPPDCKLDVLSFSAEDSQFLETRQHNVEEIARWYGVPPHLIGHLLRSTYNNIEHQSLEFVKFSLMPWLILWEQELSRKLLMPDERRTYFFRHNVDALERGDLSTRTNALKEQFFNGKITLNEWRALDDQNPIDGPGGNLHFVQQAMVPLEVAVKGPQQPTPPAEPQSAKEPDPKAQAANDPPQDDGMAAKALEALSVVREQDRQRLENLEAATLAIIDGLVAGMLERERKHAIEASRKPAEFLKRLDAFYEEHGQKMQKALERPVKAYLIASGRVDSVDAVVSQAVELHISAGREALLSAAGGSPEKFSQDIESCVSKWERGHILSYLGVKSNGKH